jgi:hypothetical protein
MPDIATHAEIIKPAVGGGTSLFAGFLLEYIGVTTPIFVAASFGAIMAVIMLKDINAAQIQGIKLPAGLVAFFISIFGGVSACFGYKLIQPLTGLILDQPLVLDQAPATAFLAFILVYFTPLILDVVKSRIEGLKK